MSDPAALSPEDIADIRQGCRYIMDADEIRYVMEAEDIDCCKNCKWFEKDSWYGTAGPAYDRFSGDCGFPSVNLPNAFAIEHTYTNGFRGIGCPCWEEVEPS